MNGQEMLFRENDSNDNDNSVTQLQEDSRKFNSGGGGGGGYFAFGGSSSSTSTVCSPDPDNPDQQICKHITRTTFRDPRTGKTQTKTSEREEIKPSHRNAGMFYRKDYDGNKPSYHNNTYNAAQQNYDGRPGFIENLKSKFRDIRDTVTPNESQQPTYIQPGESKGFFTPRSSSPYTNGYQSQRDYQNNSDFFNNHTYMNPESIFENDPFLRAFLNFDSQFDNQYDYGDFNERRGDAFGNYRDPFQDPRNGRGEPHDNRFDDDFMGNDIFSALFKPIFMSSGLHHPFDFEENFSAEDFGDASRFQNRNDTRFSRKNNSYNDFPNRFQNNQQNGHRGYQPTYSQSYPTAMDKERARKIEEASQIHDI